MNYCSNLFPFQAPAARVLILGLALVGSACTPMRSTIDPPYPYRGVEYSANEMGSIAAEKCGYAENNLPPAIHPFTTDGCSMWLDSDWLECCIEHDIAYWCKSTGLTRAQADRQLRKCARKHTNKLNALLLQWGTRIGGSRWWPFPWRWGYGYSWLASPAPSGAHRKVNQQTEPFSTAIDAKDQ